jgi:dTDP-glucose 4,6-dehydratase
MAKRIVILGGAGFIGSHLADRCLGEGHEVVAVDNFLTGSADNLKHINDARFAFVQQDITQGLHIEGPIDWIFNMASPASPIDYAQLPIETLRVGSEGTRYALELAQAKGARFLMASTSEVYGDPLVHPQDESYWGNVSSTGPRSCYDEAKRYSEAITMAFHRQYGVDTRIIRIFNTYGPRMRLHDGRIVPNLCKQALEGEPLTVYGDGSQTRSFCYVSDLVDGLYRLMAAEESEDIHMPVNIGNPGEFTILEFAQLLKEMTGTRSEIVFQPLPQDDPKQRKPVIERAKALLDWEPRVPLQEGLIDTIKYFEEKVGALKKVNAVQEAASDKAASDKADVVTSNGHPQNGQVAAPSNGFSAVSRQQAIDTLGPWFHNLHLPDGTQTAPRHFLGDFPAFKWQELAPHLPQDLNGWRVLDIGCNAGFYSFELAKRGAKVLGIDVDARYLAQARWAAREFDLQNQTEFRQMTVYDLARLDQQFDLVLFMGVFYHLRYPLLGLDIVARRVKKLLVFQTLTMPGEEVIEPVYELGLQHRERLREAGWPKMAFIEHSLANDPTNWWAPNHAGVEAMLRSSGLKVVGRPGHEMYLCEPGQSTLDAAEYRAAASASVSAVPQSEPVTA